MRVAFFGTSAFAVPSLEQVAARGHRVVLTVTQPDRPQGRGLKAAPSPVKVAAQRLGLPLAQPARLDEPFARALDADIGVAVAYGSLIPPAVLAAVRHGMLGVHPSLLPKYRGAAPVAWAILNGETTTGITIFRLNERLDAGEIVEQAPARIEPDEDAEALTARLAQLGAEALVRAMDAIAAGRAAFRPQDEAAATLAPKLTKTQGVIDWRLPAEAIARQVRALIPWPGARTTWTEGEIKVWTARPLAGGRGIPGTVMRVDGEGIEVAAGEGTVLVLELQRAGRKRMRAQEFVVGHRVCVGDHFGDTRPET